MVDILIKHFLPSLLLMSAMIYIWHLLLNKKINFKDPKLYITLLGTMAASVANFVLINNFIKIVIIIFFCILFFKFLFNDSIQKCIITPIFTQLIAMISEVLYAIVFTLIFKSNAQAFLESNVGILVTNLVISILCVLIAEIKFVRILYSKILKLTDKIKNTHLLLICIVALVIENILMNSVYDKIKFEYFLFFNSLVSIICFTIAVYSLITQNKYNKVSNKYNVATKSLNNYEDMMTRYRVANHENKNLLLTIRAMILNKEKHIEKYIDSVVENKYNDDERLLFEMSSIPTGGLRATIYSEILKIKDSKIDYNLSIDKTIKTIDLIELDTDTIVDVCKIIGVYVDNAIDAVKDLKERYINIDIYFESKFLNIKVSNNYENNIDIDKIFLEGYTTKGKNHGYGLSLVRKIVNENPILEKETDIGNKVFCQVLKIKYKKTDKH